MLHSRYIVDWNFRYLDENTCFMKEGLIFLCVYNDNVQLKIQVLNFKIPFYSIIEQLVSLLAI